MYRSASLAACVAAAGLSAAALDQVEVFRSGDGYKSYRIPALIATTKGTLLAFCEGRSEENDTANIDLLLRRSKDGGKTWLPRQTVWDFGEDVAGNPAPVVDRKTGTIWLLMTSNPGTVPQKMIVDGSDRGTRTVWITRSDDDGATWAKPEEITRSVKRAEWTWYATGPGNGIQLKSGRLVVPCDHYVRGTKAKHSHVIYSDDQGKTWQIGGVAGEGTNESAVAELADGSLILNMRSYHGKRRRAVVRGTDGGLTWSELAFDGALIEPVCQASLIRAGKGSRLLFSNPASETRQNLTVRLSEDGGKTWPRSKVLHAGPAAYSNLAMLPGGAVGCLYERGEKKAYEIIAFARFPLSLLRRP